MAVPEDEADEEWESLEGRTRLSEADFLEAWWHVPGFKTLWWYVLFLPFGSIVMVVGSPVPGRQYLSTVPWVLCGTVLLGAGVWLFRRHWAASQFTRIGSRQMTFGLDEVGLSVDSSFGEQRYAATSLRGCVETPQAFLVYTTPAHFVLIPKRAFAAGDQQALAELLRGLSKRSPSPLRLGRMVTTWVVVCAVFLALFAFLDR
jgi:hypothetical protein